MFGTSPRRKNYVASLCHGLTCGIGAEEKNDEEAVARLAHRLFHGNDVAGGAATR
jgi:hypothetical protein